MLLRPETDPVPNPKPPTPEVGKAIADLLHAEVEFALAYHEWHASARDPGAAKRRLDLELWDRRIEDAMHEVQKRQDQSFRA